MKGHKELVKPSFCRSIVALACLPSAAFTSSNKKAMQIVLNTSLQEARIQSSASNSSSRAK